VGIPGTGLGREGVELLRGWPSRETADQLCGDLPPSCLPFSCGLGVEVPTKKKRKENTRLLDRSV
jgi:hypothetical protein